MKGNLANYNASNGKNFEHRYLFQGMREQKKEFSIEFCLDTKNQVIRCNIVSIGSLSADIIDPREVFKAALVESAAHINRSSQPSIRRPYGKQ